MYQTLALRHTLRRKNKNIGSLFVFGKNKKLTSRIIDRAWRFLHHFDVTKFKNAVAAFAVVIAIGAAVLSTPNRPAEKPKNANISTEKSQTALIQTAKRQTALIQTDRAQGSVVLFRRTNSQGNTRWFAWTAAHVVEGSQTALIKVFLRTEGRKVGETTYKAKVLGFSSNIDIALLFVDSVPDAFLPAVFASDLPAEPGEPVFMVGNFRGAYFEGSVSTGVISQVGVRPDSSTWPWQITDQTTSPAYPGSSGGPVFNSQGLVLGLVVGSLDSTLNVFVPVRAISAWSFERGFLWAVRGDICPSDSTGQFLMPPPKPPPPAESGGAAEASTL